MLRAVSKIKGDTGTFRKIWAGEQFYTVWVWMIVSRTRRGAVFEGKSWGRKQKSQSLGLACIQKWWPVPESNWGHGEFQSPALPTELTCHFMLIKITVWCSMCIIYIRFGLLSSPFLLFFRFFQQYSAWMKNFLHPDMPPETNFSTINDSIFWFFLDIITHIWKGILRPFWKGSVPFTGR